MIFNAAGVAEFYWSSGSLGAYPGLLGVEPLRGSGFDLGPGRDGHLVALSVIGLGRSSQGLFSTPFRVGIPSMNCRSQTRDATHRVQDQRHLSARIWVCLPPGLTPLEIRVGPSGLTRETLGARRQDEGFS